MKFAIDAALLRGHLDNINKVLPNKSTVAMQEYILFEIGEGRLQLTGTDGEARMITSMPLEGLEAGAKASFCVKGSTILSPMREMPARIIDFEIDLEAGRLVANYGIGSFSISIRGVNEYMDMEAMGSAGDAQLSLVLPCHVLVEGITNTIYSTSTDTVRPIMTGVHMDIRPEHLSFVATNGFLLTLYRHTALDLNVKERVQLTLNRRMADLARTLFDIDEEGAEVEIVVYSQYLLFRSGNQELQCRLLEGRYPNYEVVIPTNNDKVIEADRLQLLAATSRVRIFSNPAVQLVSYLFEKEKVTLQANDVDFSTSAEEVVPISYGESEEVRFSFRAEHMVQILRTLTSESVRIRLGDSARAALIEPTETEVGVETTIAIMPLTY